MKELVRDTLVGRTLRIISGGRISLYLEQRDTSIWEKYAYKEKLVNMAHHGTVEDQEKNDEADHSSYGGRSGSRGSAETAVADGSGNINDVSGLQPFTVRQICF